MAPYAATTGCQGLLLFCFMVRRRGSTLDSFAARHRRCITDGGDIRFVGLHRPALEHGGAGNESICPGAGKLRGDISPDPAVDLDIDRASRGHRTLVTDLALRWLD